MKYDAVEFLESLFRPAAEPTPADLPTEWFLEWDERAAIMEYDGGLPRERAEHFALLDVLERMRQSERLPDPGPGPCQNRAFG